MKPPSGWVKHRRTKISQALESASVDVAARARQPRVAVKRAAAAKAGLPGPNVEQNVDQSAARGLSVLTGPLKCSLLRRILLKPTLLRLLLLSLLSGTNARRAFGMSVPNNRQAINQPPARIPASRARSAKSPGQRGVSRAQNVQNGPTAKNGQSARRALSVSHAHRGQNAQSDQSVQNSRAMPSATHRVRTAPNGANAESVQPSNPVRRASRGLIPGPMHRSRNAAAVSKAARKAKAAISSADRRPSQDSSPVSASASRKTYRPLCANRPGR